MDYKRYEGDQQNFPRPHDVWRGIGCILMVVIPLMSFGISTVLIPWMKVNIDGFRLPPELSADIELPLIGMVQDLWGVLTLTVFLTVTLYALLAIFNAMIYSMTASKNMTALTAPPKKYKKKRNLKRR